MSMVRFVFHQTDENSKRVEREIDAVRFEITGTGVVTFYNFDDDIVGIFAHVTDVADKRYLV